MSRLHPIALVVLVACASSSAPPAADPAPLDVLVQLQAIQGARVDEQPSTIAGYRYFLIDFDQPADHDHPGGVRFHQRLALHHRDPSAPMVLGSTGYTLWLPDQALEEPTRLLRANQLLVEHRFYQPSRPDPADWSLLTIRQAAADHHRVVEAFRPLYPAPWISTGSSKGGMTVVYQRRFYPDDVVGTVAYVASHNQGFEDTRYLDFMEKVGDEPCRKRLRDFQREVLLRRAVMLARMEAQAVKRGVTYKLHGLEPTFEGITTSLAYLFWQRRGTSKCDGIPLPSASDDDIWGYFNDLGDPAGSDDNDVLRFEPSVWEMRSELGSRPRYDAHLKDLLLHDPAAIDLLPSVDVEPVFNPRTMLDISDWIATKGEHLLLIYGENDPWSAIGYDLGGAKQSYKFIVPGGNHKVRIADLPPTDQNAALGALEAWTGVTTVPGALALDKRSPPSAKPAKTHTPSVQPR